MLHVRSGAGDAGIPGRQLQAGAAADPPDRPHDHSGLVLFFGGLALGRHAGYGSWRVGFTMTAIGVVVIAAIMALGG